MYSPLQINIEIQFDGWVQPDCKGTGSLLAALDLLRAAAPCDGLTFDFRSRKTIRPIAPANDVHELWLFGAENRAASGNTTSVLNAFVREKKGIFATGDHESVGAWLCGDIPRVRLLRRGWHKGSTGPSEDGADRRQTSVYEDIRSTAVLHPEGSGVPKPVWPVYHHIDEEPVSAVPHCLLSLPGSRAVRFLPAHEHEGECSVRHRGDAEFLGVAPEIVAYAMTTAGTGRNPDAIVHRARRFGSVAIFDGDRVRAASGGPIGRIAVDATFHHWIEDNVASLDKEGFGFELGSYYRNIARWLIPEPLREAACHASFMAATARPLMLEAQQRLAPHSPATLGALMFEVMDAAANTSWALFCADQILGVDDVRSPLHLLKQHDKREVVDVQRRALLRLARRTVLGEALMLHWQHLHRLLTDIVSTARDRVAAALSRRVAELVKAD
jgi:hypothetical protein